MVGIAVHQCYPSWWVISLGDLVGLSQNPEYKISYSTKQLVTEEKKGKKRTSKRWEKVYIHKYRYISQRHTYRFFFLFTSHTVVSSDQNNGLQSATLILYSKHFNCEFHCMGWAPYHEINPIIAVRKLRRTLISVALLVKWRSHYNHYTRNPGSAQSISNKSLQGTYNGKSVSFLGGS